MSTSSKFTAHSQPQGSAHAASLMDTANLTKSPKAVVTSMILELADDDARLGYLEDVPNPVDKDMRLLAGVLQQWFAPMGNAPLTNHAYGQTATLSNCAVSEAPHKMYAGAPSAEYLVTGTDPSVRWTMPTTGKHITLAISSSADSGLKSFYVTLGTDKHLVALREPGMWAIFKMPFTGGQVKVEPASPEDVDPGDRFYVTYPQFLDFPSIGLNHIIAQTYTPGWVDCAAVYASTLRNVLGENPKTLRLHKGTSAPLTGTDWDLWVNTLSTPQLFVYGQGTWSAVTGESLSLTEVVSAVETAQVDLATAKQRIEAAAAAVEQNQLVIAQLNADLATAQAELSQLETDLGTNNAEVQSNKEGLNQAKLDLIAHKALIDQLDLDLNQAQQDLDDNTATISTLNTELANAKQDLYEPGGTVDSLRTSLSGDISAVGEQASTAVTTSTQAAIDAQNAWNEVQKAAAIVRIESSRGVLFRQNEVNTVLKVTVFKGDKIISDILELQAIYGAGAYLEWQWQRYNETEFGVISSSDSRIGSGGFTLTLTPADVDNKVTFRCTVNGEN